MTSIDVESDLVGSTALVAVTVSVPVFDGAVYKPDDVIVPSAAFQITALLEVVPCTVALKGKEPDVIEDAAPGDTVTDVTVVGGVGLALTAAEARGPVLGCSLVPNVSS